MKRQEITIGRIDAIRNAKIPKTHWKLLAFKELLCSAENKTKTNLFSLSASAYTHLICDLVKFLSIWFNNFAKFYNIMSLIETLYTTQMLHQNDCCFCFVLLLFFLIMTIGYNILYWQEFWTMNKYHNTHKILGTLQLKFNSRDFYQFHWQFQLYINWSFFTREVFQRFWRRLFELQSNFVFVFFFVSTSNIYVAVKLKRNPISSKSHSRISRKTLSCSIKAYGNHLSEYARTLFCFFFSLCIHIICIE